MGGSIAVALEVISTGIIIVKVSFGKFINKNRLSNWSHAGNAELSHQLALGVSQGNEANLDNPDRTKINEADQTEEAKLKTGVANIVRESLSYVY